MSMVGLGARVTPEELAAALRDPAVELALDRKVDEAFVRGVYAGEKLGEVLDLGVAWDDLGSALAWGGAPVSVFFGGVAISDHDWGNYGPGRYLTVEQVRELAEFFRETPWEVMSRRLNPVPLADGPDEGDRFGWMRGFYEALAEFCVGAAAAGDVIITWID